MIRRHTDPRWFHLICQDDHARLSGHLARHLGNDTFQRPSEQAILATGLHDAGWPLHDDHPTLNDAGHPRDVFESNREIALPVWTASSERAQQADPYAGLLVSLHGLALSVFATSQASMKHEKFDVDQLKERFAVNQFQHAEFERQERLRQSLGLRTDLPLTHGLAAEHVGPREDLLRYDFRLLQAMDMLSLAICCTVPPAPTTQDVHPRPGTPPIKLQLTRPRPDWLTVTPWPFSTPELTFDLPTRRLEAHSYPSLHAFRTAYTCAPVGALHLTIAANPPA